MKKLTEFENFSNEDYKTPVEAIKEDARASMTPAQLISECLGGPVEINVANRIIEVLTQYGFEIVKKK